MAQRHTPAYASPVAGTGVYLQPVTQETLAAAQDYFDDPRLFELACGLGQAPTPEYLQRVLFETHDVTLWWVTGAGETDLRALAVHSCYTTLHHIGVYFWDSVHGDLEVWTDALATLVPHLFAHLPAAERLFIDLPLPVPEDFHNVLMHQGFETWSTEWLMRAPERASYGLERTVYALYNQADEDAGEASS